MSESLTTHEMLMALEEMPPHTVYRSVLNELRSYLELVFVWRCDHLPGGAYVLNTERLSAHDGIPSYWKDRDEFLLDLGYRGVRAEMVWHALIGFGSDCDRPEILESLANIREGLKAGDS